MADTEVLLLRRFAETADAEAFSEITQRYAGMVYAVCRRVLNNEAKAADATQETFFQLVKSAGQITGSLPGWLHSVATRKSIDMVRKETARSKNEKTYADTAKKEINEWDELSPYVDQAMEELDGNIREMLVRHYLNGKSMQDVGEVMGISQATASRKIEKGVSQLRGILRKKGILVSIGLLGSMLLTNTVQAAPAAVISELGKMAIAGTTAGAATAAAGTATASATTAGAKAASAGIAAGIKAKVAVAVVAATVGTGAVVTYQVNKSAAPEPASYSVVTKKVDTGGLDVSTSAAANNKAASEKSWDDFWAEIEREEAAASAQRVTVQGDVYQDDTPKENDASADDNSKTPGAAQFAIPAAVPAPRVAASPADPNKTTPSGGGYGGGMMRGRVSTTSSRRRSGSSSKTAPAPRSSTNQ
jgi:RNA polymerase sigma-70 factor (ECF subfamily)